MRACCPVPIITGALKHRIGGYLPTLPTATVPFHTGVSLRLHAPPEQWREVIYLLAGVTIWARHTWETLTLGRVQKLGP